MQPLKNLQAKKLRLLNVQSVIKVLQITEIDFYVYVAWN